MTPLDRARAAMELLNTPARVDERGDFVISLPEALARWQAQHDAGTHLRAAFDEIERLRTEVAQARKQAHRLCVACELCRANGYTEAGGSPCSLHGGGEAFAVSSVDGPLFYYCPNCTQRLGEGATHRWKAEAEVVRLRAREVALVASLKEAFDIADGMPYAWLTEVKKLLNPEKP